MQDSRIQVFLDRLAAVDGTAPLSDAKTVQLVDPERLVLIEEDGEVVAVGATARHLHDDGSHHWAVETALNPGLRFPAFEDRLLESALSLTPQEESVSVWSHRASLDAALERAGFETVRELAHFTVQLPIEDAGEGLDTRRLKPGDTSDVIALNRGAFSSHREAASLDEAQLHRLLGREGLGPAGFLLLEESDEIVGFCWTRVHNNGDGEIFRIAVSPKHQGRGLGRSLVLAGFAYLADRSDVSRGTLWADLSESRAVSLYTSIGMTTTTINREFEKPTTGNCEL